MVNVAKNVSKQNAHWQEVVVEAIEQNTEFNEIQENILNDIQNTISEVEEYIKTWDMYRDTWELNPDKVMKLYMETNPETNAFDSDVAKYKYLSKSCKKHEAMVWIGFMLIDCYPLQEGVMNQCEKWQDIFMEMMRNMVKTELNEIYAFMDNSRMKLSEPPTDVYELKEHLTSHGNVINNLSNFEKKFEVIQKLIDIIHKYKKDLDAEDSQRFNCLDDKWNEFKEFVSNTGVNLQSSREKSKEELTSKSHDFERHVKNSIEEYTLSGPFGASWHVAEAFKQLEVLNEKVEELTKRDSDITEGLAIFNITRPVNKDLEFLRKKLDVLTMVWQLTEEWGEVHNMWQQTKMIVVNEEEMQKSIMIMSDRINTFNEKDIDSRWEIFFQVRYQIQSYDRTKTLISLLVNSSLRKRHWDDIYAIVQDIQPNSEEINIEKDDLRLQDLSSYGFDKCLQSIEEVVKSAEKEIEVENALKDLYSQVRQSEIITSTSKQDISSIKNIADLFTIYKTAHKKLRMLKLSKFITPFSVLVEELDKDIAVILTLLEKLECSEKTVIEVKDLFAVFHMRKQLPRQFRILADCVEFWTDIISQIQMDPRIYKFSGIK